MKRNEIPTPHPGHQKASAAITAALGSLNYPVTRDEAVQRIGDWKIPLASDEKVALGQILQAVPDQQFPDVGSAAKAVDAHWGRIADTLAGARVNEQEAKAAELNPNRAKAAPHAATNTRAHVPSEERGEE